MLFSFDCKSLQLIHVNLFEIPVQVHRLDINVVDVKVEVVGIQGEILTLKLNMGKYFDP